LLGAVVVKSDIDGCHPWYNDGNPLRLLGFKPWREVRIKRYGGIAGNFEDRDVVYRNSAEV
jgi:hypothetical protein